MRTIGFCLTYTAVLGLVAGNLALLTSACTPEARADAKSVVDAAGPFVCELFALKLPAAGSVCRDVQDALDALLMAQPVLLHDGVQPVAARVPPSCKLVRLVEIIPERSDRDGETICWQAYGSTPEEAGARIRVAIGKSGFGKAK